MIVAGPGTGKTRTLIHRISYLIREQGIAPEACLAVTFTNKAAGEMQSRLVQLLGTKLAGRVTVKTFHALGMMILREQAHLLDRSEDFTIYDELDAHDLLKQVSGLKTRAAKSMLRKIQAAKSALVGPQEIQDSDVANAYAAYQSALARANAYDFDDLILQPYRLLKTHSDVLDHYRQRFGWVFVDEYQDIGGSQYELLRLLCPWGCNLCVIGDPDQAIYGFRGSDVQFFARFSEDYPGARQVRLTRNYRSSRTILGASGQVISKQPGRENFELEALLREGPLIRIYRAATTAAEAEYVVHSIERMLGGVSHFSLDSGRVCSEESASGLGFSDIAVLYRTDAQSEPLIEAFDRLGIPFKKSGTRRLSEREDVRGLLRSLRSLIDNKEDVSLTELIQKAALEIKSDTAQAKELLLARADGFQGGPLEFLRELALDSEMDIYDPRAERVSLMTLHAAKGLEFGAVFIVGCEDGILPFYHGKPDEDALDEERRLFYVGMTRAGHTLILTHSKKRRLMGQLKDSRPSRFLSDIQARLKQLDISRSAKPKTGPTRAEQPGLFD